MKHNAKNAKGIRHPRAQILHRNFISHVNMGTNIIYHSKLTNKIKEFLFTVRFFSAKMTRKREESVYVSTTIDSTRRRYGFVKPYVKLIDLILYNFRTCTKLSMGDIVKDIQEHAEKPLRYYSACFLDFISL